MARGRRSASSGAGRKPGRGGRRAGGASQVNDVVGMLTGYHRSLLAQRATLDQQLAAVAQALSAMGETTVAPPAARAARGRGRRGPRAGSLKEYIIKVLTTGGVMAVKDITKSVVRAGYDTKNKTLAKSVGNSLADMPQVAKVGRGKFRLK
ncbi:hypothetical protein RAS1_43970 [Phycisphaerae bacterium RAS1]|nr:hypothetical protein RAS1_43970 [Phycisphaerae bacterium RAS1]